MSYARYAEDSSVYVFLSCNGSLECCGCMLSKGSRSFLTTDEMIRHLDEHCEEGHQVPDSAIDGLREDQEKNDAWLAGPEAAAERAKIETFRPAPKEETTNE